MGVGSLILLIFHKKNIVCVLIIIHINWKYLLLTALMISVCSVILEKKMIADVLSNCSAMKLNDYTWRNKDEQNRRD